MDTDERSNWPDNLSIRLSKIILVQIIGILNLIQCMFRIHMAESQRKDMFRSNFTPKAKEIKINYILNLFRTLSDTDLCTCTFILYNSSENLNTNHCCNKYFLVDFYTRNTLKRKMV